MKFTTFAGVLAIAGVVSANNGYSNPAPKPAPNGGYPNGAPAPGPYSARTSAYTKVGGNVRTIEICTTQFCGQYIAAVPTNVATVRGVYTTKITKTVKAPSVKYVTQKYQTKSVIKTVTKVCATYTAKAPVYNAYNTKTVTVTTAVYTASVTKPVTKYTTITTTVPYVAPGNNGGNNGGKGGSYKEKRNSGYGAPAPAPNGGAKGPGPYPTAVKCAKTLQAISTLTYTSTVGKPTATVIVYGKTATIIRTKSVTKTITPPVKTAVKTVVVTKSVRGTTTKICYKTIHKTAIVTKTASPYPNGGNYA
ncbi:hypothetical protein DRE_01537 [Drechslerella stenobrocha 248]|uniref:Uncharacterized protein n=1 Tax=Drechslerella stenobrocha 248 TaxID=1043628 RepID=W7I4I8_9PEZI|nr:hypothetical protein DRE_01537 [Drechslerella stenobrocha 248]